MPSAQEELARLNWLLKEGEIMPDEPCKLILPRIEAKKRVENKPDEQGKQRTRLIKELDTPESYSDWEAEWARWIDACGGHKPIAQDLMLRHLQQVSPSDIAKLAEDRSEAEEQADEDFMMGRRSLEDS